MKLRETRFLLSCTSGHYFTTTLLQMFLALKIITVDYYEFQTLIQIFQAIFQALIKITVLKWGVSLQNFRWIDVFFCNEETLVDYAYSGSIRN